MQTSLITAFVLIGVLGMGAQVVATRLRFPAIVALMAAGLLAGPLTGIVRPQGLFGDLLDPLVRMGVAIILFEGGISLRLHELRSAAEGVRRLTTLGVLFNWLLGAAAAAWIGGFSLPVALVFGAIVVVTGPTVVIPLLRQTHMQRHPASLLKWEAIVNDPLGALLAVLVVQYFAYSAAGGALPQLTVDLVAGVGGASLLGAGSGYLLGMAFRGGLVEEYLKSPLLLVMVITVFALGDALQHESGLLAVTVMGVVMGNMRLPSIEHLRRFKEAVTVLLVSGLFILLTARLDPQLLGAMDWRSGGLVAAVILLVRPLAIGLATLGSSLPWRERLLVAWVAPRGVVAAAVAGVLSADLSGLGYTDARLLVPVVFSLVLATVVIHGFSLGGVARWLDLAVKRRNGLLIAGASPWAAQLGKALQAHGLPVIIADTSWQRLRAARRAGLRVYFGEILSDDAEEMLDISDIGYLLAASDNDARNALVCTHFRDEFGRDHVFQLASPEADDESNRQLSRELRGIRAFAPQADYFELLRRHYEGWEFQLTSLTENYDFEQYQADSPPESLLLMALRPGGDLVVHTSGRPLQGKPGDTMIRYGPPRASRQRDAAGSPASDPRPE